MKGKHLAGLLSGLVLLLALTGVGGAVGIGSGETKTGNILNPGQVDGYTFGGLAGRGVVIKMSRESGSLHPMIQLLDPDGLIEAHNETNLGTSISLDNWKLKKSGTYTIVARDFGGSSVGGYSLSMFTIPGPTVHPTDLNGGPISSGQTKVGLISLFADMDGYIFTAMAGHSVIINLSRNSGSLHPQILLYGPNGSLEAHAENGLGTSTSINGLVLSQSGVYTIVVRAYGGGNNGDYSLGFIKTPAAQNNRYNTIDTVTLPDQNGNGFEEIAVLRHNVYNGLSNIFIKDASTAAALNTITCLGAGFIPKAMAVVPEQDGNGPMLAVLASTSTNSAVKVELRYAKTGALVKALAFDKTYLPTRLTVIKDTSGNGAPELAVLGINPATGLARLEVRDVTTGALIKSILLTSEM